MANQKISELNSIGVGGLDDSDLFVLVDSSATETKHIPWGSMKIPPLIGAKVGLLTNSTGDFSAGGHIEWNVERFDTHDFWDVSSPDLFRIPAAFHGMYFDISVAWSSFLGTSGTEWRGLIRHIDGSDVEKMQLGIAQDWSQNLWGFDTPVYRNVLVDSNDYFTFWYDSGTDTSIDISTRSDFSIRLVGQ